MHHAYVALIVLATVFSMACYKIVIQRSLVVYHGIFHLGQDIPLEGICIASMYNNQNKKQQQQK